MTTQQKIAVSYIQLLADYIGQQGREPKKIFKTAGLDLNDLKNPKARFSLDQHLRLLQETLKLMPDPALGLHLGEKAQPASFGILGYLCLNSPTVLEAFENYCRYEKLVNNDPLKNEIKRSKSDFSYIFHFLSFDPLYDKIRAEFSMVSVTNFVRIVFGDKAPVPLRVTFMHPAPRDSLHEYQRIFRCPVSFDEELTSITYPRSLLDLKINQSNSDMFDLLEGKAVEIISEYREGSLAEKVSSFLHQIFLRQETSLETVARHFQIAPHTLRRRLKLEKKSYREILQGVQKEKVQSLLKNPLLSLKQISFMMKFDEPSSFYKAFKKWTGTTPQNFRKKLKIPV